MEMPDFADWVGRSCGRDTDEVTDRMVRAYAATLAGHLAETPPGAAPPGLHFCLCPALAPPEALGPDGHPARGTDLPPVPLPRRMWAGGSVETVTPLRVGERVERRSVIGDVAWKRGAAGPLCFVQVRHDYATARGVALREVHDIVYRGGGTGAPPPEPPVRFDVERPVAVDAVALFRFSALMFNGHRIHYDLPHATGVEGYDGLVVHGPLQAALLLNLAADVMGGVPRRFRYRATAPATVPPGGRAALRLGAVRAGATWRLAVVDADERQTMIADAE